MSAYALTKIAPQEQAWALESAHLLAGTIMLVLLITGFLTTLTGIFASNIFLAALGNFVLIIGTGIFASLVITRKLN